MDIEKSCIWRVFKGPKQFLTQGVSTRSYHLSILDVNQCQDLPQVFLQHLSNHLHTVSPIHPIHPLSPMDSILVLFQLYNFCKKEKRKLFDHHFHEIKFPANTIFSAIAKLKTREKNVPKNFLQNLPYILVYKSNFLDVKMGSKNWPRLIFGRTWDIPTESQKNAKNSLQQAKLRS